MISIRNKVAGVLFILLTLNVAVPATAQQPPDKTVPKRGDIRTMPPEIRARRGMGVPADPSSVSPQAARPAPRQPEELPKDDLDAILRLFSAPHYVDDRRQPRAHDDFWAAGMKRLRQSKNTAVATAAGATAPAGLDRARASATLNKAAAENQELIDEAATKLPGLLLQALEMPNQGQLDDLVRRGLIDRAEANALREEQERRDARAGMQNGGALIALLQAHHFSAAAEIIARRLRHRADNFQADLVRRNLLPELRARAGSKVEQPPLQTMIGVIRSRDERLGPLGLLTIVSTAKEPLTRLTLLYVEDYGLRRRGVLLHVPRLEPGQRWRAEPIVMSPDMVGNPSALITPAPGVRERRISVWCDQFQAEKLEPTDLDARAAMMEYVKGAIQPKTAYLTKSGGIHDGQRIGLDFLKMEPTKDGADLELKVTTYSRQMPSQMESQTVYTGTARGVDVKAERVKGTLPRGMEDCSVWLSFHAPTVHGGIGESKPEDNKPADKRGDSKPANSKPGDIGPRSGFSTPLGGFNSPRGGFGGGFKQPPQGSAPRSNKKPGDSVPPPMENGFPGGPFQAKPPEKLQLTLSLRIADDGELAIIPRDGLPLGSEFARAEEVRQSDQEFARTRSFLSQTMAIRRAAFFGDRPLAQRLLSELEKTDLDQPTKKEIEKIRREYDWLK